MAKLKHQKLQEMQISAAKAVDKASKLKAKAAAETDTSKKSKLQDEYEIAAFESEVKIRKAKYYDKYGK
jgi:hypothetical protein